MTCNIISLSPKPIYQTIMSFSGYYCTLRFRYNVNTALNVIKNMSANLPFHHLFTTPLPIIFQIEDIHTRL